MKPFPDDLAPNVYMCLGQCETDVGDIRNPASTAGAAAAAVVAGIAAAHDISKEEAWRHILPAQLVPSCGEVRASGEPYPGLLTKEDAAAARLWLRFFALQAFARGHPITEVVAATPMARGVLYGDEPSVEDFSAEDQLGLIKLPNNGLIIWLIPPGVLGPTGGGDRHRWAAACTPSRGAHALLG